MDLLKANFKPQTQVEAEEKKDSTAETYKKKALESLGGSMVFVEREILFWDGDESKV